MKIAILSLNKDLYSTQRLVEEIEKAGHEATVIDYLRCSMNITATDQSIWYKGDELEHFDAIIPRIGASNTLYGTAVIRQFETMNKFCLNSSISITRSRDKLRSLQLLAKAGVDLPKTGFAHNIKDTNDLIKSVGGAPLVIKLTEGTQGVGVVLAETKKAAESVIQAFRGLDANIIVQEYIAESNGADIRCFVLDGKVIGAIKRQAAPGDFRSNIHQGGSASLVKVTKAEKEAAIKAVKVMGLHCAGVDLLQSNKGPMILEINSSPGLKGIETAASINISAKIVKYIEKMVEINKTKNRRYQG